MQVNAQMTTTMTSFLCLSLCLLLGLAATPALALPLVNRCSFSFPIPVLRSYYSEISEKAKREDTEIGVRILNIAAMRDVQGDQKCCFLNQLLHFYVESVFHHFDSDAPQEKRSISVLGNTLFDMIKDINECCPCNKDKHPAINSVETEFNKLSTDKAATKAVAEMDTLLDWLAEVNQA